MLKSKGIFILGVCSVGQQSLRRIPPNIHKAVQRYQENSYFMMVAFDVKINMDISGHLSRWH